MGAHGTGYKEVQLQLGNAQGTAPRVTVTRAACEEGDKNGILHEIG
jgi:hypothetical protein